MPGAQHRRQAGIDFLVQRSIGSPDVVVAVIDGPVSAHPDLSTPATLRTAVDDPSADVGDTAHGTFITGILAASRESAAPGLCPGCSFLSSPVFIAPGDAVGRMSTSPAQLAAAITMCVDAGAHLINLSVATTGTTQRPCEELRSALSFAASRRCLVVAAAGNNGTLFSNVITQHPWVLPVTALGDDGRPLRRANLGAGVGSRGVAAPGERVTSLAPGGMYAIGSGTSAAAAVVTGTLALLRSVVPSASAPRLRDAIVRGAHRLGPVSVIPPSMHGLSTYRLLEEQHLSPTV
ncbi:S8 family serine peptidase [Streptomyces sp. NPDC002688]|uniref:S8 family serine peptidase n=1 Tax=Streptomyces sp. NPDC002688 TaxID=3154423 RepID=UPI0033302BDC